MDVCETISIRRLSEVRPARTPFLWPNVLPYGLTIFAGQGGVSKSLLALDLAARITTGRPWPDDRNAVKGNVAMLAAEDDPGATILPRFIAAGGDSHRLFVVDEYFRCGRPRARAFGAGFRERLDAIDQLRLIIVDPLSSYLGAASGDALVRRMLQPWADYAIQRKAALLGISHFGKGGRRSAAFQHILGSTALVAIARAVWLVAPNPRSAVRGATVMVPLKADLYARPKAICYNVDEVSQGRGRRRQPVLQFTSFTHTVTVNKVQTLRRSGRVGSR